MKFERLILAGSWLIATCLVLVAFYIGWQVKASSAATPAASTQALPPEIEEPARPAQLALPVMQVQALTRAVSRRSTLHTIIPSRPREDIVSYTVATGDSVFGIAKDFNIKPETVLWANYDQLQDSPDMLSPGMTLNIPPINGVYYQWQEGDTLEKVAEQFKATGQDILNWPGNKLDLTNPEVKTGEWVMIPDGQREFRSWVVPQIARGKSGVSKSVYGPGACEGSYDGIYGTGGFTWPIGNHVLSGNDFWSGHLGIDLAASVGDAVFASDSGVVVFAGWSTGGYGYMVMIDHGNGYQTLYGHLSAVNARCGQSVYQGTYIGAAGSTGNSTGAHLHFEVRIWGQFVNPWYVLP